MAAVLRGNVAMACAQIWSRASKRQLYPGCMNVSYIAGSDYDDDDDDDYIGGADDIVNSSRDDSLMCDRYVSSLGYAGDYVVGLLMLAIIISAMVMNSFVIWSFAARKKTIVSVDYYILTLAVSDLCAPVFAYPLAMMSTFSHRWIFGDTGCLINGFLGFFFGIVDIFVLSALGITRYVCVCHPMAFSRLKRDKFLTSLVMVLMMSALWAVLPLCGWGAYDVEPFGTSCTLQWSTPDRTYITCVFAGCLLMPVVVMSASYGSILRDTSAASRRLRKYHHDMHHSCRRAQQELRLIKITVLMSVSFLLAWMPYAVVAMMAAYTPQVDISARMSIVPTLLAKTCHITNPVIYFTMNTRFAHLKPCCCALSRPRACAAPSSTSDRSQAKDRELMQLHVVNEQDALEGHVREGGGCDGGGGGGGGGGGEGLQECGRDLLNVERVRCGRRPREVRGMTNQNPTESESDASRSVLMLTESWATVGISSYKKSIDI